MRVQRTRHTRAYVQIPNEIAQSTMSLAELGLLVKLLSLPDKNRATVERITSLVPDGRRTVSKAMTGLVERRYVHRARVQDPETGRWVTITSVSDSPTDHMPTVGEPTGQAVGAHPKGKDAERNDPPPAEKPDGCESSDEGEGEGDLSEKGNCPALVERAIQCLERLAVQEPRLRLTKRECIRLAPLAGRWLSEGFHEMEVIRTLTRALPVSIASAAALVTFRLKNYEPERATAPMPSQAPAETSQRAQCPECHAPYPLGHPGGLCRNCRDCG
ncbi:hypothetical protein [Streptomyces sp. NPDC057854]|uniref:hypothetical protein n=1 Tax=unclassified Streptomyces TaxID=2593676 RepID=UPI0036BC2EC9